MKIEVKARLPDIEGNYFGQEMKEEKQKHPTKSWNKLSKEKRQFSVVVGSVSCFKVQRKVFPFFCWIQPTNQLASQAFDMNGPEY